MKMTRWARAFLRRKTQKADRLFTFPREKQEAYLDRLERSLLRPLYERGATEESFEVSEARSYAQYKAQRKLDGFFLTFVTEAAALVLGGFLRKRCAGKVCTPEYRSRALYVIYDADPSLIPEELKKAYPDAVPYRHCEEAALTEEDAAFLRRLRRRRPLAFAYRFKMAAKLAMYRAALQKNECACEALLVCAEFSYTSSLLTWYLEREGCAQINWMHGEKLFYMRDSFCRFTRFYVWDEHYLSLFRSLRVPECSLCLMTQTRARTSPSETSGEDENCVDFCYYLANESAEEMRRLAELFRKLRARGFRLRLRAHPRYTDQNLLTTLFPPEEVEAPDQTLEQSFAATRRVLSLYSTVLYQAWLQGKDIVIDDLKNPAHYECLKSLSYIMMAKQHRLLSEFIQGDHA